jgi:hypothetical protein
MQNLAVGARALGADRGFALRQERQDNARSPRRAPGKDARMKIPIGVVISLFAIGCAMPPDHESGEPGELVDETSAAATAGIPRWRLFLGGPDLHLSDGRLIYYDQPRASDRHAGLIAVRVGDEGKPRKWVRLYLEMQRRYGDGYFLSLIANHQVTVGDLVVIEALLLEAQARGAPPPLLSTLGEPVGDRKQELGSEQRPGPPSLPDWGTPGAGSGGLSGPSAPHPYLNGNLPGQGGSPGPDVGVTPGGPGPRRTDFCDGMPCAWGDTSGIEWKPVPVTEKWTAKLGRFLGTYREGVRATLRRDVFHDGKNPGCMSTCNHLSNVGASALVTGVTLICIAATDGACLAGVAGGSIVGVDYLIGAEYLDKLRALCLENICTAR